MSSINNYKIHWIAHAESCANLGQSNYIDKQTINENNNEYFDINNYIQNNEYFDIIDNNDEDLKEYNENELTGYNNNIYDKTKKLLINKSNELITKLSSAFLYERHIKLDIS